MPLVSFIIPCYRQGHFLPQAVGSVLSQTFAEVEAVVIDDGSPDDPFVHLGDLAADPRVVLIRQENLGLALARNRGIEASRGEFLAFLDSDDWLAPDYLELLLPPLQQDPRLGFTYCDMAEVYEGDGLQAAKGETYSVGRSRAITSGDILPALLCGGYFTPNTVLVRRAALDRVGLFAPDLGGNADYDLWLRIAASGFQAQYVDHRLAYYRIHGANMSFRKQHMADTRRMALERVTRAYPDAVASALGELVRLTNDLYHANQVLNEQLVHLDRQFSRQPHTVEAVQPAAAEIPPENRLQSPPGTRTAGPALSRSQSPALANLRLFAVALLQPVGWAVLNRHFDRAYYCGRYPDVRGSRWPALLHYAAFGYREHRDPAPSFSTSYYFRKNPDVFQAMLCPLLHYAAFGRREGRASAAAEPAGTCRDPEEPPPEPWPGDRPLISVVVPCFNYGHFLEEALESLEAQTFRDFEVLVVEGGSTDPASRERVRKLEESGRYAASFFYRSSPSRTGDNRNFGIERARGKYICCLDADDRLASTFLEITAFCAEVGDHDIVSPSLRHFGEAHGVWHTRTPSLAELSRENTISSAALFRRKVWETIGGFHDFGDGPEHAPEDWDFWLRAVAAGYRVTSVEHPLYDYRVHPASLTARALPSGYQARISAANREALAVPAPARPRSTVPIEPLNLQRLPSANSEVGILLCLPWITFGGAESLLREVFRSLAASGRRVLAVTTAHLKPLTEDDSGSFAEAGIPVYPLPEIFEDARLWPSFLRSLIVRHGIGHMVICGSEYAYTQAASLRAAFPHLRVYDQLFNEHGHLRSNRNFSTALDLTLVPSEFLGRTLTSVHGEAAARVRVIRHGRLPAPPVPDPAIVLPPAFADHLLAVFAGRLAPEKAPVFFIELAAHLKAEDRWSFLMLGDGPERPAVESAIERLGLRDRVFFPGPVPDIRPYLRQAHAVVVPSVVDGMPNVVLEAMSEGVPVVASEVGGIPEMLEHEKSGFLCQPGDLEEFARRIRQLASEPALREAISAAARERVRQQFSFEATLAAYKELFLDPGPPAGAGA